MVVNDKHWAWIKAMADIRVQWLTGNDCYKKGGMMPGKKPRGVMVHSTGCLNPMLSRYLSPDDGHIGRPSTRHWNQPRVGACVHAFIGYTAGRGDVAIYQTLPWTMPGWHCAGRGNRDYISFEICEDERNPNAPVCVQYFRRTYAKAALLTAHLCARYHLDPMADGVVLCHCEGHRRGIASNHADVLHWWRPFGKDMDAFRRDVAFLLRQGRPFPGMYRPNSQPDDKEDVYTMEIGKEELKTMIQKILRDELAAQTASAATASVPLWAERAGIMKKAVEWGITADGSRPMAMTTRAETAAMVCGGLEYQRTQLEDKVAELVRKALGDDADVPGSDTAAVKAEEAPHTVHTSEV